MHSVTQGRHGRKALLPAALAAAALAGLAPAGRAQAQIFTAALSGPAESPANASPGTGSALVTFNPLSQILRVQISFSGLLGTTTASHIHSATALPGVGTAIVATATPTFTDFPLGLTAATYDHLFDMSLLSSYNPSFVTANGGTAASAESSLLASLATGTSYLNIHTTQFPGGEIRGFLAPAGSPAVPESGPVALLLLGLLPLGLRAARRRKHT